MSAPETKKTTASEFTLSDMALDGSHYSQSTLRGILIGDRNTLTNIALYEEEGKPHNYTKRDVRLFQARIVVLEDMLKKY